MVVYVISCCRRIYAAEGGFPILPVFRRSVFMNKSKLRFLWGIPVIASSLALVDCRTKPVVTRVPSEDVQATLVQGDSEFQKLHLYGWRQAESWYKKAYGQEASEAIREKLLLTRFLVLMRETDEDIADRDLESAFGEICSGRLSLRQRVLCELAGRYRAGSSAQPSDRRDPNEGAVFDVENSPLDAYLHALYVQAYGMSETHEIEAERAEKFRDSPLFIYLYLGKKTSQRAAELEKTSPEFAELFDFMGGEQFQRTQYSKAKASFKKAVELIPDYTRSLNGLGNIYLFALEDFETALKYFQLSLKWNPANSAALFGSAMVFHNLGRYAESNGYLDRTLQSDLARGGHNSEEAVRYYQGESNYYKAYNYHLLGNPTEARKFVEAARKYLPRSDHVNYLSGLLYYEARQLRPAKDDFMRVLQSGASNCDAHYYLGRIYREADEELDVQAPEQTSGINIPKELAEYLKQVPLQRESKYNRSLDYMLASCSCMEAGIRSIIGQMASVPSMDLDSADKTLLLGRLNEKLQNSRRSSSSLIDGMLRLAATADTEKKNDYLNLMREVQSRIAPPGEPPALSSKP